MEKILVITDDTDIRRQVQKGVGKAFDLMFAVDGKEALAHCYRHLPKIVIFDLDRVADAIGYLRQFIVGASATRVIVIGGSDGRELSLTPLQTGVWDICRRPIDLQVLKGAIERAIGSEANGDANMRLSAGNQRPCYGFHGIIGHCPQMVQIFSTIGKVALSDVAVLVTGESGTGKELVAKALHALSPRKKGPFVPINCGAIPENLLESELFGSERGAFTGAHNRILGKAEYAHKGTIFLDEIGELPANLQVKLLRFLQEKVLQRVGGREDITIDARIISATNMDIAKAINKGLFREDLYYRISVITINLPPLRERGEDIMILANLFLKRAAAQFGKKVKGFSAAAATILKNYYWPGNVRELENRVQRAVIMTDSPLIQPADLGSTDNSLGSHADACTGVTLKDARDRVERQMIVSALGRQSWNVAKTAELLGVSRPTLYDLMKKYSLSRMSS